MSRAAPLLADAVTSLYFEPWHLLNTELRASDTDVTRYLISAMPVGKSKQTVVRKADGTELARLIWRDVFSDKLVLRGGPERSVKEFFVNKRFTDEKGGKYEWVEFDTQAGYKLELFALNGKERGAPIARFNIPRKEPVTRTMLPATLALNAQAASIEELVVVTLALYFKSARNKGIDASLDQRILAPRELGGVVGTVP
ncbi:hypothetical protein EXIGLDRAFT_835505 [Exidia glandulosa HHB12029]|uniref:DUF6593 domain-containing protein n=1 Tax=Exidia glandulosa HHB12029 TaxID=1314781 RepID=A0A165IP89_EXIGL|nr:hypothetical protein EXIGLDRAFT_835505 [Exidia glandulosa HHB12029]